MPLGQGGQGGQGTDVIDLAHRERQLKSHHRRRIVDPFLCGPEMRMKVVEMPLGQAQGVAANAWLRMVKRTDEEVLF